MKILMTMIAAVAFSSAVSAQRTSVCTVTEDGNTLTLTFDGAVRTVFTGDAVNIVNRRTGEVLDVIAITGNSFGIRCRPAGRGSNGRGSGSSTSSRSTGTTTSSTTVSNSSSSGSSSGSSTGNSSGGSSSGGGFPASAALGLP